MKKKEIILSILALILSVTCFVLYDKSKNMVVLNEIKYKENGYLRYKVHLTDSSYYGTDYLDEDMQYISSIIDKLEVSYNYNAEFDKQDKFEIITNLTANIRIVDGQTGKVIYTKSEGLNNKKETKKEIGIEDKVTIDYKKYNQLANEFKTKYGISANCKLSLSYVIQYRDDKTGISQSRLMTMEMPLSEQMITITRTADINNNSSYIVSTTKSWLNTLLFVGAIVILIIDSICIVKLIDVVKKRLDSESKYDRFIKKTLKEYDAYITVSNSDYEVGGKKVFNIPSFKELLDVRNNLEKPIIYYKIDEDHSKFSIISDEIYEYEVSRKEMD